MIEASGVHQFHRIDDAGGHYGKCQTMKPPPPYKQRPARDIVKLTATVDASTTGSERGRGSRWPAARTAVGKWEKIVARSGRSCRSPPRDTPRKRPEGPGNCRRCERQHAFPRPRQIARLEASLSRHQVALAKPNLRLLQASSRRVCSSGSIPVASATNEG